MKCNKCPYSCAGHRDSLSDICDSCTCDPDTGWVGFTDHSIGKHFTSDKEANEYYRNHKYDDYEDNDVDVM